MDAEEKYLVDMLEHAAAVKSANTASTMRPQGGMLPRLFSGVLETKDRVMRERARAVGRGDRYDRDLEIAMVHV